MPKGSDIHVKARFATDDDAADVARLASLCMAEMNVEIPWCRLAPYWLVAELGDAVVAAMQVVPCQPIGRVDFLFIDPSLSKKEALKTIDAIATYAEQLLRVAGVTVVSSYIDTNRSDDFLSASKHRGWVGIGEAAVILKRL